MPRPLQGLGAHLPTLRLRSRLGAPRPPQETCAEAALRAAGSDPARSAAVGSRGIATPTLRGGAGVWGLGSRWAQREDEAGRAAGMLCVKGW